MGRRLFLCYFFTRRDTLILEETLELIQGHGFSQLDTTIRIRSKMASGCYPKASWGNQSLPEGEIFPCTHGDGCKECAEYTSFQKTAPDHLLLQSHLLWDKLVALKCFS